jgi:hypothetical protein
MFLVLVPTENTSPTPSLCGPATVVSILLHSSGTVVPGALTALTYSNRVGETSTARYPTAQEVILCYICADGLK